MAAVFGDVLYWLATLIAGITIGVALYRWMFMPPDDPLEVWLLVAIGVVTWLTGRGLAGRFHCHASCGPQILSVSLAILTI